MKQIEFENKINLKFGSAIDLDSGFCTPYWKKDTVKRMNIHLTIKGKTRNEKFSSLINAYEDTELLGYMDPMRHLKTMMSGNGIRHSIAIFFLANEDDERTLNGMAQLAEEYTPEHRYDDTWHAKFNTFSLVPYPSMYNSVWIRNDIKKEFGMYEEYIRITNSFIKLCETLASME